MTLLNKLRIGVRANRLALLGQINGTFTRIADFRQLAV